MAECENELLAFRVEYPAAWWVNPLVSGGGGGVDDVAACTIFAPEEVPVRPGSHIAEGSAIWFRTPHPDDPSGELVTQTETTVDGHPAVTTEAMFGNEALLPEGTLVYEYEITVGDRKIEARTTSAHHPDYEANKRILDAMMESLEIED